MYIYIYTHIVRCDLYWNYVHIFQFSRAVLAPEEAADTACYSRCHKILDGCSEPKLQKSLRADTHNSKSG